MKLTLITACLLLFSVHLNAQEINGVVKDSETGEILPYGHIYLKNQQVGEVGRLDGSFRIRSEQANDTLLIKYVGYEDLLIPMRTIDSKKLLQIKLVPRLLELNAVTVTDKEQLVIVGNRKKSNRYTGWGDFESARGRARGLVLDDLPCPAAVKALGFRLKHNDWDSVAFRVEFYAFENNELGTLINQQDIVFNVEGKKDWTELDLSDYQIRLCDQVVVVLEWVDAWGVTGEASNLLTFSTNNKTGSVYTRKKGEIEGKVASRKGVPSIYLKLYE